MPMLSSLLLLATLATSDLPTLHQQLKQPAYASSFRALFRRQQPLAPWARRYLRGRSGVEGPGSREPGNGAGYEYYSVCKPHDCPDNYLVVRFEPGGRRAWALVAGKGKAVQFFGDPDGATRAALVAYARKRNYLP